jgi:hypothetical protein
MNTSTKKEPALNQVVLADHAEQANHTLDRRDERFSMRKALEQARAELRVHINSSHQAAYADALVAAVPAIAELVERRQTPAGRR